MEADDDEGLVFEALASDLLKEDQVGLPEFLLSSADARISVGQAGHESPFYQTEKFES